MRKSALRVIVIGIMCLLLPGMLSAASHFATKLESPAIAIYFTGGVIGWRLASEVHRRFRILLVAEHELTHAGAALLLLRRIAGISINKNWGRVTHSNGFGGSMGNDFIALAPYALPFFTCVFILIRPCIAHSYVLWYDALIGLGFGYDVRSNFREFSTEQTDIRRCGVIYSVLFVSICFVILFGILASVIIEGYHGPVHWTEIALYQPLRILKHLLCSILS